MEHGCGRGAFVLVTGHPQPHNGCSSLVLASLLARVSSCLHINLLVSDPHPLISKGDPHRPVLHLTCKPVHSLYGKHDAILTSECVTEAPTAATSSGVTEYKRTTPKSNLDYIISQGGSMELCQHFWLPLQKSLINYPPQNYPHT